MKLGHNIVFSNYFPWRLSRHLLFWLSRILMCFIIGIPFVHSTQLFELYSLSRLLSNYVHDLLVYDVPFTYFVCYFLIPNFLLKGKYRLFALYMFLITGIGLALYIFMEYNHNRAMEVLHHEPSTLFNIIFIIRKIKVYLTYTGVSFILFAALKLFKSWYLKEKENQNLIRLNGEAQMENLQSRIHPHFLFNTLNTIYSFALFDGSRTKSMLDKLYNILHYMIYDCDTPEISLSKEIQALLDYINLEKERYGNKLQLNISHSGSFREKRIAPLMLQPFVENAFKHGASKMINHPWIDISCEVRSDFFYFNITNGTHKDNSISDTPGIGHDNIKRRLNILYSDRHILEISRTDDSYKVKLVIPVSSE